MPTVAPARLMQIHEKHGTNLVMDAMLHRLAYTDYTYVIKFIDDCEDIGAHGVIHKYLLYLKQIGFITMDKDPRNYKRVVPSVTTKGRRYLKDVWGESIMQPEKETA